MAATRRGTAASTAHLNWLSQLMAAQCAFARVAHGSACTNTLSGRLSANFREKQYGCEKPRGDSAGSRLQGAGSTTLILWMDAVADHARHLLRLHPAGRLCAQIPRH